MKQALGALALLALIFGGILSVIGWQEWSLYRQGSVTPQTITLADLEKNGPGSNVHVTVTNVDFGINYVNETKNNVWQAVWIPLIQDARMPSPPVKVVMQTSKLKSPTDVDAFCQPNKTITGVITNSIRSLGGKEREQLQKDYPHVNFDSVWVLNEGRTFPSGTIVFLWLGIGVGLIVLGVLFSIGWLLVRA